MTSTEETRAPARQETNGLGIASMVLGILWLGWLGSLLAVIFGHVSLGQIKKSRGAQTGRGFAVAGLVLGYVGVGVAVLIVVVVLAVGGSSTKESDASCATEKAVLQVAEEAYSLTFDEYGTESQLVSSDFLRSESSAYDIQLSGSDYVLIGIGRCS